MLAGSRVGLRPALGTLCLQAQERQALKKNSKNMCFFAILSLQERMTDYMIEEDWATLEHKFTNLF
jgi:hypothetical protein